MGSKMLLAAVIAGVIPPAAFDGAYCSTDPEYSFRIDSDGYADAGGRCRTISTENDLDGWLVIKHDCPYGTGTIDLKIAGDSAVAILEDGHEYQLARCP